MLRARINPSANRKLLREYSVLVEHVDHAHQWFVRFGQVGDNEF